MAAIRHVVTPYLCSTAAPKRDRARARKMKEWDAWAAASASCPLDALLLCSRRRTFRSFRNPSCTWVEATHWWASRAPPRQTAPLCLHAPREGRCFNRSRWPSMRGQPESRRSDFWRHGPRNGFWLRGMGTESIPHAAPFGIRSQGGRTSHPGGHRAPLRPPAEQICEHPPDSTVWLHLHLRQQEQAIHPF
jgi:hypothetical protein